MTAAGACSRSTPPGTRLWEQLGHPGSERVVEQALACARRRSAAFDPQQAVVLHGEPAAANAARALTPREGTEDAFVLLVDDRRHA